MVVGNNDVGKTLPRLRSMVGSPVQGDRFWGRGDELEQFIESLDDGDNIALVAPRRVGKTSLMREASSRIETRYICLHLDLEASQTPADFFAELARVSWEHLKMRERLRGVFDVLLQGLQELRNEQVTLKIQELFATGWQARGDRLFAALVALDQPVVLFLDEVPIFIHRLLTNEAREIDPAGIRRAEEFLLWLRAVAQRHSKALRIVVAGSIGLDPILHRANLSATMNAYRSFELHPWDDATSRGCLHALATEYDLGFESDADGMMLRLLGAGIPHHVQMFFDHVRQHLKKQHQKIAFPADIERVYCERMLSSRGHRDLSHYEERLKLVIEPSRLALALDLLTQASLGKLTWTSAKQLARDHIAATSDASAVTDILEILQHDGYLRDHDGGFCFESNFVRDWWKNRFAGTFVPACEREVR